MANSAELDHSASSDLGPDSLLRSEGKRIHYVFAVWLTKQSSYIDQDEPKC